MVMNVKVADTQPPFTPSNMSNQELVRHVEHLYPRLQGPLSVMLQRFAVLCGTEALCATVEELEQKVSDLEAVGGAVACPHCGSTLELELRQEEVK